MLESRKIVAGEYLITRDWTSANYQYIEVKSPNLNTVYFVTVPEFAAKMIFVSLQTAADCQKFLKGKMLREVFVRLHAGAQSIRPKSKNSFAVRLPRTVYVGYDTLSKGIVPFIDPALTKEKILKSPGRSKYVIAKPIKSFRIKEQKIEI